jgi:hypothetical protein
MPIPLASALLPWLLQEPTPPPAGQVLEASASGSAGAEPGGNEPLTVGSLTPLAEVPRQSSAPWAGIPLDEVDWGGWARIAGEWNTRSGDGERLSAEVSDLRLWNTGRVAGLAWRASLEAGRSEVGLADLWVRSPLDGRHDFYFGRFRTPFLRSGFIEENRLLFSERTPEGEANDRFEEGIKLVGQYPAFALELALQNASDGVRDALRGTMRADVHLLGAGVPWTEQSYAAPRSSTATLGLAATDDGTLEQGESYALDFSYRGHGQFGHAELVDRATTLGGGTPFSLTYGVLLVEDLIELGLRLADQDDAANTRSLGAIANRYLFRDLAELQFSIESVSSDDETLDGFRLRLALLLEL